MNYSKTIKYKLDSINYRTERHNIENLNKVASEFFEAVRSNNIELVGLMLENDPSLVNQRILGDASLLNCQVWVNKVRVDVQPGETRSTPALHYSVIHGQYKMVKLLLEFGAEINSIGYENNHENTPCIVLAAWEGGDSVLELLLQNGADPNLESSNNVSAIATALKHGKEDTVKLLLKYGAEMKSLS